MKRILSSDSGRNLLTLCALLMFMFCIPLIVTAQDEILPPPPGGGIGGGPIEPPAGDPPMVDQLSGPMTTVSSSITYDTFSRNLIAVAKTTMDYSTAYWDLSYTFVSFSNSTTGVVIKTETVVGSYATPQFAGVFTAFTPTVDGNTFHLEAGHYLWPPQAIYPPWWGLGQDWLNYAYANHGTYRGSHTVVALNNGMVLVAGYIPLSWTYDDFYVPSLTGPANVVRTQDATYEVLNAGDSVMSDWAFFPDALSDETVSRPADNNISTWHGVIVIPGTVSVTVKQHDQIFILSKHVSVAARNMHTPDITTAQKVPNGTIADNGDVIGVLNPPAPDPAIGNSIALGLSKLSIPVLPDISTISTGPNMGYSYIRTLSYAGTTPSGIVFSTWYKWTVPQDVENPSSQFYKAQCGNYQGYNCMFPLGLPGEPPPQPVCTSFFGFIGGAKLLENVLFHEAGMPFQLGFKESHYSHYLGANQTPFFNYGDRMEAVVGKPSENFQLWRNQVLTTLTQIQLGIRTITGVEPCANDQQIQLLGNPSVDPQNGCRYNGPVNLQPYASCTTPPGGGIVP